jgi:hypothetical protein
MAANNVSKSLVVLEIRPCENRSCETRYFETRPTPLCQRFDPSGYRP